MLLDLLAILAPIFICAAIGFAWARLQRPFDSETITGLVTLVGTPCLVFDTLVRLGLPLESFGRMALVTAAAIAATMAVSAGFLLVLRKPLASFLPALTFGNAGNMGLSVCLFAFGDEGLALAIGYFAVVAVVQFTVGVGIAAGRVSPARLLQVPVLYAVAAAVAYTGFGWILPKWVANTVHLIGGFTIPLMLIALGVSLANLRVRAMLDSVIVGVGRLLIGFAVGVGVAWGFALPPLEAGVVIVECSMPVAVFNYLFALRYNRSPEAVAGSVVLSTVIGFCLLPLLLWLVLSRMPA
jgi:malate permease and related proteins